MQKRGIFVFPICAVILIKPGHGVVIEDSPHTSPLFHGHLMLPGFSAGMLPVFWSALGIPLHIILGKPTMDCYPKQVFHIHIVVVMAHKISPTLGFTGMY